MKHLNYIGCKHTLLPTIRQLIKQHIPDLNNRGFADLFAGTGVVGFNLLPDVSSVDSNDLEYYSYVTNLGLLQCYYSNHLQEVIRECNNLSGVVGLITKNYSPYGQCERMFFTPENAQKSDAIRQHLNLMLQQARISSQEFYYLLGSLLQSTDKVANTSCVYGAYLKKWKASAQKPLTLQAIHSLTSPHQWNDIQLITDTVRVLETRMDPSSTHWDEVLEWIQVTLIHRYLHWAEVIWSETDTIQTNYASALEEMLPHILTRKNKLRPHAKQIIQVAWSPGGDFQARNRVTNLPVELLTSQSQFDVVYLDPPYNQRQYSGNYSPLNYLAHYRSDLQLNGKTGLIDGYSKSNFCSKARVKEAFQTLFSNLHCNYVVLSYNNEGLLGVKELRDILLSRGSVHLYRIPYKKFKAQKTVKLKMVEEYLWVVNLQDTTCTFSESVES